MRLILVRHGQTPCNLHDIWHGWDECELNEAGVAQAEAAATRLAGEPIEAVYCSDSKRTIQTASAVALRHGLTPIPDPAFRERSAGRFEGLTIDRVLAIQPNVWDERSSDFWGWRPPNGETLKEVLDRVLAGIARVRAEYPQATVAIATHMNPVRTLISHYTGVPLEATYEMPFPSTGVTIFDFNGDDVRAEVLNSDEHVLSTKF
jgi:broad specificity phosphatase PhoE